MKSIAQYQAAPTAAVKPSSGCASCDQLERERDQWKDAFNSLFASVMQLSKQKPNDMKVTITVSPMVARTLR